MAKSSNAKANSKFRQEILDMIREVLIARGEEVLDTASNTIVFPFVNELNSDEWVKITVAIPTGSIKDKTPFDGYEQAQDYSVRTAESIEKAKANAIAKERKIAFDTKKRENAERAKAEKGE